MQDRSKKGIGEAVNNIVKHFHKPEKRGMMGYKTSYGRILKWPLYMTHKAIKRYVVHL